MKKLLAVLLLTLSGLVYAAPPTQTTTEYCTNLARFARYVTVVRDSNVDRLALKEKVFASIDAGKAVNPQFTADDKVELDRIIDILYFRPNVTGDYAAQSYFQHCVEVNSES